MMTLSTSRFTGGCCKTPASTPIPHCLPTTRFNYLRINKWTWRKAFPSIPIILLADAFDITDAISRNVTTFVRKGEPAKLIAAIHEHAQ
jgi:hypothetical protein